MVTATTDNEIRLGRNPRFRVWDPEVRPDGYPDEIVFTIVQSRTQPIDLVVNNDADYTSSIGEASPDLLARIETQHAGRLHAGASTNALGGDEHDHPTIRQHRRAASGQLRDRSRPHGRVARARRCRHLPAPAAGFPRIPAVLSIHLGRRSRRPMDGAGHAGSPAAHRCVGHPRARRDARTEHRPPGRSIRVSRPRSSKSSATTSRSTRGTCPTDRRRGGT